MFEDIKEKVIRFMVKIMMNDNKGEMSVIKLVIAVFLIAILAAALIPTSITSLAAANTSSWTEAEVATYDAIGVLILVAIIAGVAGIAYKAFD